MSNYTNLKLTIDNHIAVLTLNNPPAHTWTKDSLASLKQLISDLNANKFTAFGGAWRWRKVL